MNREPIWIPALCRAYAVLLYAYPRDFRIRFGGEMRQVFRERCRAAGAPLPGFFFALAKDWILSAGKERMASMSPTWNSRLMRAPRGLAVALIMLAIGVPASAQFLQAYVITGASMEKSVQVGDHLIVHKLGPTSEIRRGDVVSFRYPLDPQQIFVKRVIGIPGDRIRLVNKQVIRNGRRLVEPYVQHDRVSNDAYRDNFPSAPNFRLLQRGEDMLTHYVANGDVVVPEGALFVLGDNRDESLDSRYWGFVPREGIVGRPLFVYWSWDKGAKETRWNRTLYWLATAPAQEVNP
jgi:signal peptidase I